MKILPFQRQDVDVPPGTMCEAAGWGFTSHSGRKPDELQQVERPVKSREECNRRPYHDNTITDKMLCTDSRKKDTCKVPGSRGSGETIPRPVLLQRARAARSWRQAPLLNPPRDLSSCHGGLMPCANSYPAPRIASFQVHRGDTWLAGWHSVRVQSSDALLGLLSR